MQDYVVWTHDRKRAMKEFVWSPQMTLDVPAMDSAHEAFLKEMTRVAATPDNQFGADFFSLIAKIERDFREEEELMEQINFPGLNSHREQHARALAGLHHVVPHVMNGDIALGRKVVELLHQWFMFHLSTMDMTLAAALNLNQPKGFSQPDAAMHQP